MTGLRMLRGARTIFIARYANGIFVSPELPGTGRHSQKGFGKTATRCPPASNCSCTAAPQEAAVQPF